MLRRWLSTWPGKTAPCPAAAAVFQYHAPLLLWAARPSTANLFSVTACIRPKAHASLEFSRFSVQSFGGLASSVILFSLMPRSLLQRERVKAEQEAQAQKEELRRLKEDHREELAR